MPPACRCSIAKTFETWQKLTPGARISVKRKNVSEVANGVANVVLRLLSNVMNTNAVAIYE